MNYTKNYHLPQWVKSDRIMMDDFNRMCADLENGLTSNKALTQQNHAALSGRIEQVAQEAQSRDHATNSAVQTSLAGGLFHMAYNHYHVIASRENQQMQDGFFHQTLGRVSQPSAVNGFISRGDALWIARGSTAYTSVEFRSKLKQTSEMKVVKGNLAAQVPLTLQFTPQGPGYFSKITLSTQIHNNECTVGNWHIAFINAGTGEYEGEFDFIIDFEGEADRIKGEAVEVPFYYSGGVTYRIEITTKDIGYDAKVNYHSTTSHFMANSITEDMRGTISRTVTSSSPRTDGAVLVQYRARGTGGALSLTWNGAAVPLTRTRTIANARGMAVTEAEFRKNGVVPASSTIALSGRCNVDGELLIYSWGMATI